MFAIAKAFIMLKKGTKAFVSIILVVYNQSCQI